MVNSIPNDIFGQDQIESIYGRQIKCMCNDDFSDRIENTVGKGENAVTRSSLFFPFILIILSRNHQNLPFCCDGLNLSQTSPGFISVCKASPLKALWEKEKLLLTSNFSFSHCLFYSFEEVSAFYSAVHIKFEIFVCKLF